MKPVLKSALKTAAARLAEAHKKRDDLAKQIVDAEADRNAALLAGDDRLARLIDLNLVEWRMAAKRETDRIALLTPVAENERREQAWPQDIVRAKAKLLEMERRQQALNAKPKVDRSAAEDSLLDNLTSSIPVMRAHIVLLERMEAA